MTDDSVFIGTDATENWQNKDFRAFSKPYFDRGKAWSFTAIDRNIYVNGENNDERNQNKEIITNNENISINNIKNINNK